MRKSPQLGLFLSFFSRKKSIITIFSKKIPERMASGKMEYKKSRSGGSVSSRDLRLAIADWSGCDAGASYPPEGLND